MKPITNFDLRSIDGDKILVLGIGGGNDAAGAFAVASIIKNKRPDRDVVYGACFSRKGNYDGFSFVTEGLYVRNSENQTLNDNRSLRLVQILRKYDGVFNQPFVFISGRGNDRITEDAIEYFSGYSVITVENGGDSITGGADGSDGFDRINLMRLIEMRLKFTHIVLGIGCDGESTMESIEDAILRESKAIIGEFTMDEVAEVFATISADIRSIGRRSMDTPDVIVEVNTFMRNNPDSIELYNVPRHERKVYIPYFWLNKGMVFHGHRLQRRLTNEN